MRPDLDLSPGALKHVGPHVGDGFKPRPTIACDIMSNGLKTFMTLQLIQN
jgi:hypothetical protein